jgi:catechol 2,3-dioxygenase-like lactoylglutathione lyase family enzyme
MTSPISAIDHIAVTTSDLDRFVSFYQRVLDAEVGAEFSFDGEVAVVQLSIGGAMLSVHRVGHGHALVARAPTAGAADVCFRWSATIDEAVGVLREAKVEIIDGPVRRTGAGGTEGQSVYFRDPDGNLVELLSLAPHRAGASVPEPTTRGRGMGRQRRAPQAAG